MDEANDMSPVTVARIAAKSLLGKREQRRRISRGYAIIPSTIRFSVHNPELPPGYVSRFAYFVSAKVRCIKFGKLKNFKRKFADLLRPWDGKSGLEDLLPDA